MVTVPPPLISQRPCQILFARRGARTQLPRNPTACPGTSGAALAGQQGECPQVGMSEPTAPQVLSPWAGGTDCISAARLHMPHTQHGRANGPSMSFCVPPVPPSSPKEPGKPTPSALGAVSAMGWAGEAGAGRAVQQEHRWDRGSAGDGFRSFSHLLHHQHLCNSLTKALSLPRHPAASSELTQGRLHPFQESAELHLPLICSCRPRGLPEPPQAVHGPERSSAATGLLLQRGRAGTGGASGSSPRRFC